MIFLTPTIVHSREDQELLLQQELGRRREALADEIEDMVGRSVAHGAPRAEG